MEGEYTETDYSKFTTEGAELRIEGLGWYKKHGRIKRDQIDRGPKILSGDSKPSSPRK